MLSGFAKPSSTPEPLQAPLFEVVSNALQEKPTIEKLLIQGIVPRPMTLAGLRSFVRSESEKFGRVAEAAKIRAE
jgi:tripartite-type tricarboxylate transporter receptor subunit TctC